MSVDPPELAPPRMEDDDDPVAFKKPSDPDNPNSENADVAETLDDVDPDDDDPFATPSHDAADTPVLDEEEDDRFAAPQAGGGDAPSFAQNDDPIDDPFGLADFQPVMRENAPATNFADVDIDELTKPIDLANAQDWTNADPTPPKTSKVDALDFLETGEVQALRRTLRVHCFECYHWHDRAPTKGLASYDQEMAAKERLGDCLFGTPNNAGKSTATFPVTTQKYSCSRGEHLIAKFAELYQQDGAFRRGRISDALFKKIADLLNDETARPRERNDDEVADDTDPPR